ncbi:MAG: hypothetical protein ACI8X5_003099 [Planctomycetota bacterium]|jgi:hypothetical protein
MRPTSDLRDDPELYDFIKTRVAAFLGAAAMDKIVVLEVYL